MTIQRSSFSSSAISGAEYDDDLQTLSVTFTSGRTYTLKNVPQDVYDQFAGTASPGRFWHDVLKAYA